jgi:hypothetical protein
MEAASLVSGSSNVSARSNRPSEHGSNDETAWRGPHVASVVLRMGYEMGVEMTFAKTELVLFDTDSGLLENLKRFSRELPYISYEVGYGPAVVAKANLDALWITPMAAVELFGANPPFPLHEARVLETPPAQLARGMPKYGVVGVATSEDDPKTPEYNVRLVLSALLRAVNDFNSRHRDRILRVGILPDHLDLKRLDPAEAFKIIREVYERG